DRAALGWMSAIALLTLLVYARSCDAPFQFDDYALLVAHERGNLSSPSQLIGFARTRILPVASLAANYVIGAENPLGYHAVSLDIHVSAALLLFQLALALCATPRVRATWLAEVRVPFAGAAALFFACHPIQIQAVPYIVQRASSMAAAFYLASVLCYVWARNAQLCCAPGRPRLALAGSFGFALAAFLSKENTASLPLTIL